MCKSVFKKVRNVMVDPLTASVAKKSSAAGKIIDPVDVFGYQDDRNQAAIDKQKSAYDAEQARIKNEDDLRKYEEELNRSNAVTRINAMFGMGNGEIKGGTSGLGTVAVKPEFLDVTANANARQAGYDEVRQNSLGLLLEDIARNRADTTRNVGFGLQRNGLFGGSVDVDTHKSITDANQRSIIQANQYADNQVAQMRSNDESTRADLISRINAGLDADSAATTATQRMLNNRQEALTTNPSGALNNLFAGIGSAWNGYQFANGAANPYGNMQKSVNNNSRYGGTISY